MEQADVVSVRITLAVHILLYEFLFFKINKYHLFMIRLVVMLDQ